MAKMSSKFVSETASQSNENKSVSPSDEGVDDSIELNEYYPFPIENEKASKKMASRRKVEMLWERKRLKDQLGDFDDYEDYDDEFNF
jgi:hypothetical protein